MTFAEAVARLARLLGTNSFHVELSYWRHEHGASTARWKFYAPRYQDWGECAAPTLALLVAKVEQALSEEAIAERTPAELTAELKRSPMTTNPCPRCAERLDTLRVVLAHLLMVREIEAAAFGDGRRNDTLEDLIARVERSIKGDS